MRLEPLPGFGMAAVERINRWWLHGWPIYFVTSRVGVEPKHQTENWLMDAGIARPTVIVASRKGMAADLLGATHAIDDKAENAWMVHWLSPKTRIYLLDAPYNRVEGDARG